MSKVLLLFVIIGGILLAIYFVVKRLIGQTKGPAQAAGYGAGRGAVDALFSDAGSLIGGLFHHSSSSQNTPISDASVGLTQGVDDALNAQYGGGF